MKVVFLLLTLVVSTFSFAESNLESWMSTQFELSVERLKANINTPGTMPGTVLASPSKEEPNYYYHWVRDASLVMLTLERLFDNTHSLVLKNEMLHYVNDYADITRLHQQANTAAGLGEVKFNVDGTAYTGPWGRPQNDGPALRAMTLIKYANYLIGQGHEAYVREVFYDSHLPSQSLIKKDLEYVSHNWKNHDFDLWEEVMGHHFFTRLAQRRALLEGAAFARKLNDPGAAAWYEQQARALETALSFHWDESQGYFKATLNRVGGVDYKSGMDSSVIIGIIETARSDDTFLSIADDRFMSSVQVMVDRFRDIYPINHNRSDVGVAIGRYPEDQYDGYQTGKTGNPWFLATTTFASYHYRLAKELREKGSLIVTARNQRFLSEILGLKGRSLTPGKILNAGKEGMFEQVVTKMVAAGDKYMERVRLHIAQDGSISEQMDRSSGFMQGAQHLTWSYSSFINAYYDRQLATESLSK